MRVFPASSCRKNRPGRPAIGMRRLESTHRSGRARGWEKKGHRRRGKGAWGKGAQLIQRDRAKRSEPGGHRAVAARAPLPRQYIRIQRGHASDRRVRVGAPPSAAVPDAAPAPPSMKSSARHRRPMSELRGPSGRGRRSHRGSSAQESDSFAQIGVAQGTPLPRAASPAAITPSRRGRRSHKNALQINDLVIPNS